MENGRRKKATASLLDGFVGLYKSSTKPLKRLSAYPSNVSLDKYGLINEDEKDNIIKAYFGSDSDPVESFTVITQDRSQATKIPINQNSSVEFIYELLSRKFHNFDPKLSTLFISDPKYERPIRFSENIYSVLSDDSKLLELKNWSRKNTLFKKTVPVYPELCCWAQVRIKGKWKKRFIQIVNNDLFYSKTNSVCDDFLSLDE